MKTITTLQQHCKNIIEIKNSEDALSVYALEWCTNHPEIKLYEEDNEGTYFDYCKPVSQDILKISVVYWDYRQTDPGMFQADQIYYVDVTTDLEIEDNTLIY